jgi:chemotaxis-related protein WspD
MNSAVKTSAPVSALAQGAPVAPQLGAGCWAEIGIYGNSSCPELQRHVHCRNCGVYAQVGSDLLNRPLPADYLKTCTEQIAKERPLREHTSHSALPFRIGSEWLAFPTAFFQEITERRPIHFFPHSSKLVLGIVNVRGELLLCISLGHALGFTQLPPHSRLRSEYERLLVLTWNGDRIAFPVDEVHGPQRFYPEHIKAPPPGIARPSSGFSESVLQWQQRTLVLLDLDLVFSAIHRSLS